MDIATTPLHDGQSSVRIYVRKEFFGAHNASLIKIAPEHGATFMIDVPGDRDEEGFKVAVYHVPTEQEQGFTEAALKIINNHQLNLK